MSASMHGRWGKGIFKVDSEVFYMHMQTRQSAYMLRGLAAAACNATCTLTSIPNRFVFQMANEGGRVKMQLPPMGQPLTWQLQVRSACTGNEVTICVHKHLASAWVRKEDKDKGE